MEYTFDYRVYLSLLCFNNYLTSQDNTINDNFAKLAEALYIADRKAREAVDMRANIEKAMAAKEKEEQESKLRLIAQKARDERSGIIRGIHIYINKQIMD